MYEIVTYIPLLVIAAFASLPVAKNLWTKHKDDKAMPYIETALVIFALVLCTAALVTSTYNPFLYFRF
jgi:alginate O-acetyltransferase complex protein AlgI